MDVLLIYLILQIINVILSTIKSIVTIKGPKLLAAIMNALSYSVNIIVVIYTVMNFSLWIKILITAGTNFAGTYLGIYITEKLRKDRLWEIKATVRTIDEYLAIKHELKLQSDIKYNSMTLDDNQGYLFYVYAKTKQQSKIIREILWRNNADTIATEQTVTL